MLAAVTTAARAAVTVSFSGSAPTENLVFSQSATSGNNYAWNGLSSGRRDVGQGFQITQDAIMQKITLHVASYGAGAPLAAFTLKIFETSSAAEELQNGTLFAPQKGVLPMPLVDSQYITFELDTPISLAANKFYTFVFSFDALASNRSMNFTTGTSSMSGTRWNSTDGENYSAVAGAKLTFFIEAQAVPEGDSIVLLGSAGAMVLLARLRRRP